MDDRRPATPEEKAEAAQVRAITPPREKPENRARSPPTPERANSPVGRARTPPSGDRARSPVRFHTEAALIDHFPLPGLKEGKFEDDENAICSSSSSSGSEVFYSHENDHFILMQHRECLEQIRPSSSEEIARGQYLVERGKVVTPDDLKQRRMMTSHSDVPSSRAQTPSMDNLIKRRATMVGTAFALESASGDTVERRMRLMTKTLGSHLVHGGGMFTDYMVRVYHDWVRTKKKDQRLKDLFGIIVGAYDMVAGFEYARTQILKETLEGFIMNEITSVYKSSKSRLRTPATPGNAQHQWRMVAPSRLHEHVNTIFLYKRAEKCLRFEVDNWLKDYRKSHAKHIVKDVEQDSALRESFWSTFHDPNAETGPPCPKYLQKPPQEKPTPWIKPRESKWRLASEGPYQQPHPGSPTKPSAAQPSAASKRASVAVMAAQRAQQKKSSDAKRASNGKEVTTSPSNPLGERNFKHVLGMAETPPPLKTASGGLSPTRTLGRSLNRSSSLPFCQQREDVLTKLRFAEEHKVRTLRSMTSEGLDMSDCMAPKLRPPASLPNIGHRGVKKKKAILPPLSDVSRQRFLRACASDGVLPVTLPFVTGASTKLNGVGKNLVDGQLLAIAAMVADMPKVELVDLGECALLTDDALCRFLREFHKEGVARALDTLGLRNCTRAGISTINAVLHVLPNADLLQHLDLSYISIPPKFRGPLCRAIGDHASMLTVKLANCNLTGAVVAKECLSHIFRSDSVKTLDMSWNAFTGENFDQLGLYLEENETLTSLSLASCSCVCDTSSMGSGSPVSMFLEHLAAHKKSKLKYLDISFNRMDYRGALIAEDALDTHRALTELDVSNNDLGVFGVRSMLRLLSRGTSGLLHLTMEGCYKGDVPVDHSEGLVQAFNATNPGGRYSLDLKMPYHRSMLRMLYKTCERFKLSPSEAFQPMSPSSFQHVSRDPSGAFPVPSQGQLSFTFGIDKSLDSVLGHCETHSDFLEEYFVLMRFRPSFRKIVPIFGTWMRLRGLQVEQLTFLDAFSKDFRLELPHVLIMSKSNPETVRHSVCRLLPCIENSQRARFLILMNISRVTEFIATHKEMQQFIMFNVQNPTGRYKLNLGKCSDHAVAEQLILMDRWEIALDKKLGHADVSQRGNRSHVRNEMFQGRELASRVACVSEWSLPEHSMFEFDYSSNIRPPSKGAFAVGQTTWDVLLSFLYESECTPDEKLEVIRNCSHHFYCQSKQLRELLGFFKNEEHRGEALTILYTRLLDIWNTKIFRVRFDNHEELRKLGDRLGHAKFFPFIQPENYQLKVDFGSFDQRIATSILVTLMFKEKMGNIRNPVYIREDGTRDELPLGVPRSWESSDKVPKAGTFSATYVCAPEDRKFDVRKKLLQTYSFVEADVKETDVMWWTGLGEVPTDVLDFLEYMICEGFSNADEVFEIIDGVGGNGEITIQEFRDGLQELNCEKFRGPSQDERILRIFRYLDPGGEGSVSLGEWQLLNQLWSEFELSVEEFVKFLVRIFGDDLSRSWEFLDDDGSGELDEDEFVDQVQAMGYFGPARIVFGLLDNSDDGNISLDEFEVLEKYRPAPSTASPTGSSRPISRDLPFP